MKSLDEALVRTEITERVRKLQPDLRPRWGRMSAHQMICHLSDAFRVSMGEKAASTTRGILHRSVLKWLALYVPVPWPPNYPTRPELDQLVGGTSPVELEQDRQELLQLIERFCFSPQLTPLHPIFGRMTRWEWMRWGYLHTDHHLRQFGR